MTIARPQPQPRPEPGKAGGSSGSSGSREACGADTAVRVAEALAEAVRPLGEAAEPVQLSLTGGKDSRLVAAALTAAGVPFTARTHGFASHPDVIVAALLARHLGVEQPSPSRPRRVPRIRRARTTAAAPDPGRS